MTSGINDYIQVSIREYALIGKYHLSRFFFQKGIRSAEQATAEDKANNHEEAAKNYMTAAEWLMQAMKCKCERNE